MKVGWWIEFERCGSFRRRTRTHEDRFKVPVRALTRVWLSFDLEREDVIVETAGRREKTRPRGRLLEEVHLGVEELAWRGTVGVDLVRDRRKQREATEQEAVLEVRAEAFETTIEFRVRRGARGPPP